MSMQPLPVHPVALAVPKYMDVTPPHFSQPLRPAPWSILPHQLPLPQAHGHDADLYTYHSLVDVYSKVNHLDEAEAFVQKMYNTGLHPKVQQYTSLLQGCAAACDWDRMDRIVADVRARGLLCMQAPMASTLRASINGSKCLLNHRKPPEGREGLCLKERGATG